MPNSRESRDGREHSRDHPRESEHTAIVKQLFPDSKESLVLYSRVFEFASKEELAHPESATKARLILLAKTTSALHIHKAKESPQMHFQIGRTWDASQLSRIEDHGSLQGCIVTIGKPYFWRFSSVAEKTTFVREVCAAIKEVYNKDVVVSQPSGLQPSQVPYPMTPTDVPKLSPQTPSMAAATAATSGLPTPPHISQRRPSKVSISSSDFEIPDRSGRRSDRMHDLRSQGSPQSTHISHNSHISQISQINQSPQRMRDAESPQRGASPRYKETRESPHRNQRESQRSKESRESQRFKERESQRHKESPRHKERESSRYSSREKCPGPPDNHFKDFDQTYTDSDEYEDFAPRKQLASPLSKEVKRLSAAALRFDSSSPRISRNWQHSRNPSATSAGSVGYDSLDMTTYKDLESALVELQGSQDGVESLLTTKVNVLREDTVSNVVQLDAKLDELDTLLAQSLDECVNVQKTFARYSVQLATISDIVGQIEARDSGGLQVLTMNKKALLAELENSLSSQQLSPDLLGTIEACNLSSFPPLEDALIQVSRVLSNDAKAYEDQQPAIQHSLDSFGSKFQTWFKTTLGAAISQEERLDTSVMRSLYFVSSVFLFLKNAQPNLYQELLDIYVQNVSSYFIDKLSALMVQWKKKLETICAKREPLPQGSLEQNHTQSQPSHEHTAGSMAKRTMTLRVGGNHHQRSQSNSDSLKSLVLREQDRNRLDSLFDELLHTLSDNISGQQQVLVEVFHMSSHTTQNFETFCRKITIQERIKTVSQLASVPKVYGLDTSRSRSQAVLKAQRKIFANMPSVLSTSAESLTRVCVVESVYLVSKLEIQLKALEETDQVFLREVLNKLRETLVANFSKFTHEETRSLISAHFTCKRRVGLLPAAVKFVGLVLALEQPRQGETNDTETRKLVDTSYSQLFRALVQIFERSAQYGKIDETSKSNAASPEDKDALNYHVTIMENTNLLVNKLGELESSGLQEIVLQARSLYRTEAQAYVSDVLRRPFRNIIDFLAQSEAQQFTTIKKKTKVTMLKRAWNDTDMRDLRKNVETLRKRVEKHFGEEDHDKQLVERVWHAISAEAASYYTKLLRIAQSCGEESILSVSKADFMAAFHQ